MLLHAKVGSRLENKAKVYVAPVPEAGVLCATRYPGGGWLSVMSKGPDLSQRG
jgi:hypothetical protein